MQNFAPLMVTSDRLSSYSPKGHWSMSKVFTFVYMTFLFYLSIVPEYNFVL